LVHVTNISGPASLRFKFGLLVAASFLALCTNLCAGQTLCGSIADQESPATKDAADGGPRPVPESGGGPEPSGAVAAADEVPYPSGMATPALPGTYAETISRFSRQRPPGPGTISLTDIDASMFRLPRQNAREEVARRSFDWKEAVKQSFLFLTVQQTLRLAIEPDTRANLGGPFFKDYFRTVRSLRGWGDGDSFTTNYIGHPMMGAVSGFIQVHNDPAGMRQTIEVGKTYRDSRLKALAWSAAYSLQFELGLLSEASIGNVGMTPRKTSKHPMGFVDLVVTPVVGTSWLIGEDALDRYLIDPIERRTGSRALRALTRSLFNPTRSIANLLRFKRPWHRDTR
jgi:hypothetical protein